MFVDMIINFAKPKIDLPPVNEKRHAEIDRTIDRLNAQDRELKARLSLLDYQSRPRGSI